LGISGSPKEEMSAVKFASSIGGEHGAQTREAVLNATSPALDEQAKVNFPPRVDGDILRR
jgi:hypothetical protein